jgi:hypothetical protein
VPTNCSPNQLLQFPQVGSSENSSEVSLSRGRPCRPTTLALQVHLVGLCVGNRETRADGQRGEPIERIAAGVPVGKLLVVEVVRDTRAPSPRTGRIGGGEEFLVLEGVFLA